jgi:hypothetical protein
MKVHVAPAFFNNGTNHVLRVDQAIVPGTTDGAALGTSALNWSDLFLDSGGVINFDGGDVTLTHSSGALAIDGGGVVIGHTAQITTNNGIDEFQILGTGATNGDRAAMAIGRWSANNAAPGLEFMKSRHATVGSHSPVLDNDRLAEIKFVADVNNEFNTLAAMLRVEVDDASPAQHDTGGAFVFHQAGGGGVSLRETMRLDAAGDLYIADGGGVVVGHTSQVTAGATFEFQVLGTGQPDSGITIGHWSTVAPGEVGFVSGPGSTIGAVDIVADNHPIGVLRYYPADGTDLNTLSAELRVEVDDSSPGAGDIGAAFVFKVEEAGTDNREVWRMTASAQFISGAITDNPANITDEGSIIAAGGLGFTDVANAHIDDATHGSGTVTHYIGNQTIDTTSSDERLKENWSVPNGLARDHLELLAANLQEYDYVPETLGGARFVGFGAQSLSEVLPQYVVEGTEDNYWSVGYKYMIGPLLWGWQNLEKRVMELEQETAILRGVV